MIGQQALIWKGLFFENEVQPPNYIIVDPELTEPAQIIFPNYVRNYSS